jgi:hypothetical protein
MLNSIIFSNCVINYRPNLSTIDLLNLGMIKSFDKDFTLRQFERGALQALLVISNALSQGDLESLEELLDKETYYEIKENLRKYSGPNQLAVNLRDVVKFLPYNTIITRYHDTKNGRSTHGVMSIALCRKFSLFLFMSQMLRSVLWKFQSAFIPSEISRTCYS